MQKELLEQRKNEILAHKKELENNETTKESLVWENENLSIEYQEKVDCLMNLKKEMNEYIRTKRINKFSKILVIASIISVLGISGIAFLSTITPTASSTISNVVASSLMTLFIGGLSSIPYFETRKYLKNVDINEIKEQIEQNELEIGKNIEKSELNDKKIENIDNRKLELEEEVYRITVALLRDEEERNIIMSELLENYPSYEFVEVFTDNMYEKSKTKVKK